MDRSVQRLWQGTTRRALALFSAVGALGAVPPADAVPLPERAALEGRVADMRRHLSRTEAEAVAGSATATLLAQAGKWNNWPNWTNWANWRNG